MGWWSNLVSSQPAGPSTHGEVSRPCVRLRSLLKCPMDWWITMRNRTVRTEMKRDERDVDIERDAERRATAPPTNHACVRTRKQYAYGGACSALFTLGVCCAFASKALRAGASLSDRVYRPDNGTALQAPAIVKTGADQHKEGQHLFWTRHCPCHAPPRPPIARG